MSGGTFDYKEFGMQIIIDEIEHRIQVNGKKKNKNELEHTSDWYKDYPEDLFHYEYPPEVIKEFEKAVDVLKKALIYSRRVDYLLAGDDGEEAFIERLNKELNP